MTDAYRYKVTWTYRAAHVGNDQIVFLPLPKDVPEFEIECRAVMDEVREVTGISDTLAPATTPTDTDLAPRSIPHRVRRNWSTAVAWPRFLS